MHEEILSVGIDIGTSTTQLIFSRLIVENQASSYTVPRIDIVEKHVDYRSQIYFTPLKSPSQIDAERIRGIVQQEYRQAGRTPQEMKTGAVIITGETARKENANEVLSALSDMAGDFVVATAGPDLESVLSARGAGADVLSKERAATVANLDVGGGTTNIALYDHGKLCGVCCLDIGGRLVRIENDRIAYVYHKISDLAAKHGISLKVGDKAELTILRRLCSVMADQLAQALYLSERDKEHGGLYTNDGRSLPNSPSVRAVTYSGGVADYVYHEADRDLFRYGDIGILLGEAIRQNPYLSSVERLEAVETIRATVVGAGTHTTEVSGSTITFSNECLPMKNVPILKVPKEEETPERIADFLAAQLSLFRAGEESAQVAIAFEGDDQYTFDDIQRLADAVVKGAREVISGPYPLFLILERDIAKALGYALKIRLGPQKPLVCIDGIETLSGDYADVGEPIGEGRVLPVVIKTLVFNSI